MTRSARSEALHGCIGALLLAFLAGPVAAEPLGDPPVGQPAPDFTATDSNGVAHALSGLRGRTVVLEWTNHDCPFVRKHYDSGNMQALQKEATSGGTVWFSVVSSAPGRQGHVDGPEANSLTDKRGAAPSAVLLDPAGDIGKAYGARATPHMFVIRPDGILAYKGAIDDRPSANPADIPMARNHVRAALAALAANAAVDPAATRAYGCSVKYAR